MKRMIMLGAMAVVSSAIVGCQSTNVDEWRSDLKTQLCPARFKPVYEVMKDKGVVSGSATESWTWWILGNGPDRFANEIGGPLTLKPGVKEAAFQDACDKSGATILLAPRFTVTKKIGWFWFDGSTTVSVEGVPARLVGAEEVKCVPPACPCGPAKACGCK